MRNVFCTLLIIGTLGTANSFGVSSPDTPAPRKIDSYGNIKFKDEKARLDGLVAELKKEPHAQGYIMVYAGRRARRGEAATRARLARKYLVKAKGLDARRIVALDGGYRQEFTVDLFVVPPGAAGPLMEPTVDPGEVQIFGGGAKRRRAQPRP